MKSNKIIDRDYVLHRENECPRCKGTLVRNALMNEKKLGYITYACSRCNYHLYQKLMR